MKWCIALIDFKQVKTIPKGLTQMKIKHELGIPMVRVLRKRFKNKEYFEDVPLMFNYGFIKLPNKVAMNKDKLIQIKDRVPGVFSWMFTHKIKGYQVETVKNNVVEYFMALANKVSIFSSNDINNINKGDFITLKGYPFEGLEAQIIDINYKTKKSDVLIYIMEGYRKVTVDFENIFYSIYTNFDDAISKNSIDTLESYNKGSLDKLHFKNLKA